MFDSPPLSMFRFKLSMKCCIQLPVEILPYLFLCDEVFLSASGFSCQFIVLIVLFLSVMAGLEAKEITNLRNILYSAQKNERLKGVVNQTLTEDRGACPIICCSSSECHPPCVILHSTCSWVLKGFFYSKRLARENCTMPDKCRTFTLWYAKNVKPLYRTRLALLVLAVMGHKLTLAEIKLAEMRLAVMRD